MACLLLVILSFLSTTFIPGNAFSAAQAPTLKSSSELSTAGFYTLSWNSNATEYELQQSASKNFEQVQPVYLGPDTATVISGMPDSMQFYRVRSIDNGQAGPWSETVAVTVQHHTLTRALLFLLTGMVVFIATALLITLGARSHREQH